MTTDAESAEAATEQAKAEEKPKRAPRKRAATSEAASAAAPEPRRSRAKAATADQTGEAVAAEAAPSPAPDADQAAPAAAPKPRRSRAKAAAADQPGEAVAAEAAPSPAPDAGEAAPAAAPKPRSRRAAPKKEEPAAPQRAAPPRLMERYRNEIRGQMIREFGYASPMQAPEVKKVVLNVGLGEGLTNGRALETTPEHIAVITGQKPVITKASKSVAGFKVREGQSIGVMVTLRGKRMYDFLDRMISTALPRIRDFRGVPRNSFDGRGNYSLGFREQIVFPEIDYGSVDRARGFQVVIATSARTDAEGFRLLELMGMPFARPAAN